MTDGYSYSPSPGCLSSRALPRVLPLALSQKAHEPTLDEGLRGGPYPSQKRSGKVPYKLSLKFAMAPDSVTGSPCDVTGLASIQRSYQE